MTKFRKKPVVIEAVQWHGPADSPALAAFAGHWASIGAEVYITTPEGAMRVSPGDFVIRGVKGEFYPCKPDIFAATYDPVADAIPAAITPADHIEQFFACGHLPPRLQSVSKPFADLAAHVLTLPRNPERTVALRKLLEAKDAAVRAVVAK